MDHIKEALKQLEAAAEQLKTEAEASYTEGNNKVGNQKWDKRHALRIQIIAFKEMFSL